jgi:hypothetical protein
MPKRTIILAIGGKSETGDVLDSIEMFDPAIGRWQPYEPMPCPLVFSACSAIGPLVYVLHGQTVVVFFF